jgi:hypothetical protein
VAFEILRAELSRIPAVPPRPADLLPGLRLSGRVMLRQLAPFSFLGLFAFMPVVIFLVDPGARLAYGQRTTGRVEHVERESQQCGGHGIGIRYSFSSPEGLPFRGEDTACPRTPYSDVREGDAVTVVYLASDPTTNAIAGGQRVANAPPWPIFLVFPLMMALFLVPLFWPQYSQLRRDRRLFRTGVLAGGTAVYVAAPQTAWWPGWPRPTQSTVFVKARLPTGGEREVRAVCSNDWLLAHLAPGTEVTVVCEQDGSRAVLLESYLR